MNRAQEIDRDEKKQLEQDDLDSVNVIFGVAAFLYVLVFFFYSDSLLDLDYKSNALLEGLVYWSFFKLFVPIFAVLYSILNITDIPIVPIVVVVVTISLLNTSGLFIALLYEYLNANSPTQPNNLASDRRRCCVHYSILNSGCGVTDGPCVLGFPQTQSDLSINISFSYLFWCVVALLALEIVLMVVSLFLKTKEEEDTKSTGRHSGNPDQLSTVFEKQAPQTWKFLLKADLFGKKLLNELSKIPNVSGFTGKINNYHRKKQ